MRPTTSLNHNFAVRAVFVLALSCLPLLAFAANQQVDDPDATVLKITLSPSTVNFGNQIVGTTSAAQTVTISNVGRLAEVITSISTAAPFSQTNTCPRRLNPGKSCTAMVTFAPIAFGSVTGSLVVHLLLQRPVSAALTGNGEVLSSIQVTPSQAAIQYGQTLQMIATGIFADGSTQDFTSLVTWTSSDPSIIIVSNDPASPGLAMTESYGVVTLTATYGPNGVGGSGVIAAKPLVVRFAYVANQSDSTISAYTMDAPSGRWRDNGYYNVINLAPTSVAVDPYNRFVYAVGPGGPSIFGFSINKTTGALTALPTTSIPNASSTQQVVIDPLLGQYLYVVDYTNGVSAFSIDANTGALTAIGNPVAIGGDPAALTIDSGGSFLYALDRSGTLYSFQIDRNTGSLTSTGSISTGSNPLSVSIDPSNCVFVPNYADGTVSAYQTSSNGSLTQVAGSPFTVSGNPSSVLAMNGWLFITNPPQNQLLTFQYGTTCALTGFPYFASFSSEGTSPVAATSDGNYLYVANSGTDEVATFGVDFTSGNLSYLWSTRARVSPFSIGLADGIKAVTYPPKFALVDEENQIETFSIDPNTGALTSMTTSALLYGNGTQIATDPAGLYVYDSESSTTTGSVTFSYSLDQNSGKLGFLSLVNESGEGIVPEPSGRWLYEPAGSTVLQIQTTTGNLSVPGQCSQCAGEEPALVDPTGKFLLALGDGGDGFSGAIDPMSGNLGAPQIMGTTESCAPYGCPTAADPRGRFFYIGNSYWGAVDLYSIDPASGAITILGGVGTDMYLQGAVVIDPTGRFLYLAGQDPAIGGPSCAIAPFAIDQTTGGLTSISADVEVGQLPSQDSGLRFDLVVDSSGKFLYVLLTTDLSSALYGFSIDQTTGALTPLAGSPFPLSGNVSPSVLGENTWGINALALTGTIQ